MTEQTQQTTQQKGGAARAATATRGDSGQFLATGLTNSKGVVVDISVSAKTKPLTIRRRFKLKTLPEETDWWNALAGEYPGVNLYAELLKALDWYGADRVKSPKLFFRNWVEKAYRSNPPREDLTPDQIRARLRV